MGPQGGVALTSDRPLLFLDIDGVLNCQGWSGPDYEELKRTIDGLTCVVPPQTSERVRRILQWYDPVWATAWLGKAATWREELGLDDASWPYLSYVGLKLPEIIRYAGGRKWAWVDDDAYWELQQLGWIEKQITQPLHRTGDPYTLWGFGDEGLIIGPDGRFGITDEIVDALEVYALA